MFVVHATAKLLNRVKPTALHGAAQSTTSLGAWYATVIAWRAPVALLVNEATLLPVLLRLAPARTLTVRFPAAIAEVLAVHAAPSAFIDAEMAAMDECRLAKTANRSTVGIMTEFSFLAGVIRTPDLTPDLTGLAVDLARTPCSPLYKTHTSPDRALAAHLACHEVEQPPRGHAEPLSRLIHPSPGHGRPARADRRNETCP